MNVLHVLSSVLRMVKYFCAVYDYAGKVDLCEGY